MACGNQGNKTEGNDGSRLCSQIESLRFVIHYKNKIP